MMTQPSCPRATKVLEMDALKSAHHRSSPDPLAHGTTRKDPMITPSFVRVLAGTLALFNFAVSRVVNRVWLTLAGFVGVNPVQFAFCGLCLVEINNRIPRARR